MAEARRRGGNARGKVGGGTPPAEAAPAWCALSSVADVRAGYGWAAAALIERRIDPRTANAIGVLLASAARAMEYPFAAPEAHGPAAPRVFLPDELGEPPADDA